MQSRQSWIWMGHGGDCISWSVASLIEQTVFICKETPAHTSKGLERCTAEQAPCLPKCSVPRRKFSLLSWNINQTCHQCGFLENNSVCPLNQASVGAFSLLPPIPSHHVDASSNRHDWLTFRLVPFCDLQLSLAWPLPPNTPTDTPFTWIQPRSWTGVTVRAACRLPLLPQHVKTSLGGKIQSALH